MEFDTEDQVLSYAFSDFTWHLGQSFSCAEKFNYPCGRGFPAPLSVENTAQIINFVFRLPLLPYVTLHL